MFDSPEALFAAEAVREAGLLARRVQRELCGVSLTKGDKSPVTVGDFAVQALVARRLALAVGGPGGRPRFDPIPLVGEESSADLRDASGAGTLAEVTRFVGQLLPDATPQRVCDWIDHGRPGDAAGEPGATYWTLDPIDGTKGFLRGDQYAVALALVRDGRVEVAALACPELEEAVRPARGGAGTVVVAVRGGGAFRRPLDHGESDPSLGPWTRITVSPEADPRRVRVLRSVESGHTDMGGVARLVEAMGIEAQPVGMDSQAKAAVLAAGGGELVVRLLSPDRPDYREKVWDQAAGLLVVEEAGGRVTDLAGEPLDFTRGRTLAGNRGVLATNGHVHAAALSALGKIGAAQG